MAQGWAVGVTADGCSVSFWGEGSILKPGFGAVLVCGFCLRGGRTEPVGGTDGLMGVGSCRERGAFLCPRLCRSGSQPPPSSVSESTGLLRSQIHWLVLGFSNITSFLLSLQPEDVWGAGNARITFITRGVCSVEGESHGVKSNHRGCATQAVPVAVGPFDIKNESGLVPLHRPQDVHGPPQGLCRISVCFRPFIRSQRRS